MANTKKSKKQYQIQDPESGGDLGNDDMHTQTQTQTHPSNDQLAQTTQTIESLRIENKNLKRILVVLSIILVIAIGGLVGAAVVVAVNATSTQDDPGTATSTTATSIATATATEPPKTTIVYFWPDSDSNTTVPSSLYDLSTPVTSTTTTTNSTTNGNNSNGDATNQETDSNNSTDNNNATATDNAGDKPDLAGEPPSGVEVISASDLLN